VDIAISALTLHHLEPPAATAYLAAMDRVARMGVVVNDLARSRWGWALVWLVTRLLACGRMSRHDGPLSILRAYTAEEARALCAYAGMGAVEVTRYDLLLRFCLVLGEKRSRRRAERTWNGMSGYDVVVVGPGPEAPLPSAERGWSVLLPRQGVVSRPKICGELFRPSRRLP
jgi:hypothetical protein